jgi:hypothetical protein
VGCIAQIETRAPVGDQVQAANKSIVEPKPLAVFMLQLYASIYKHAVNRGNKIADLGTQLYTKKIAASTGDGREKCAGLISSTRYFLLDKLAMWPMAIATNKTSFALSLCAVASLKTSNFLPLLAIS